MKLLVFILLLSHVNFSMFIAQLDEVDVYDQNGQQEEDINSLVEYIAITFHVKHKPFKDTDDDNARYFHSVKLANYDFAQTVSIRHNRFILPTDYPLYTENTFTSILPDIQGPPPKES